MCPEGKPAALTSCPVTFARPPWPGSITFTFRPRPSWWTSCMLRCSHLSSTLRHWHSCLLLIIQFSYWVLSSLGDRMDTVGCPAHIPFTRLYTCSSCGTADYRGSSLCHCRRAIIAWQQPSPWKCLWRQCLKGSAWLPEETMAEINRWQMTGASWAGHLPYSSYWGHALGLAGVWISSPFTSVKSFSSGATGVKIPIPSSFLCKF